MIIPSSRSPCVAVTQTAELMLFLVSIFLLLGVEPTAGFLFTGPATTTTTTSRSTSSSYRRWDPDCVVRLSAEKDSEQRGSEILKAEAEALKAKAEQLRSEIEESTSNNNNNNNNNTSKNTSKNSNNDSVSRAASTTAPPLSPWAVVSKEPQEEGDREFRLYGDIGREPGTWMDPRWGASGKRIEFSLDVRLTANRLASQELSSKMIRDNTVGTSSPVYVLETANFARLREGFDRMEIEGGLGAYRIDTGRSGSRTIRMFIPVEGTVKADQAYVYGDVSIPSGCLYLSLPVFGSTGIDNLSIKEGLVSVRQVGWHTGWRREESRILGVFTAKSLLEAKQRDRF